MEMVIQISYSFSCICTHACFYMSMFILIALSADGKHPACDKSYVGRREFSFTLENDIYIRFQSFNSVSELENSIKEKCPFKIDIGPVYSVDVRFHAIFFLLCGL